MNWLITVLLPYRDTSVVTFCYRNLKINCFILSKVLLLVMWMCFYIKTHLRIVHVHVSISLCSRRKDSGIFMFQKKKKKPKKKCINKFKGSAFVFQPWVILGLLLCWFFFLLLCMHFLDLIVDKGSNSTDIRHKI